ncbi:MAG TPA: glycoside hydrolase family 30 beta sandwich domain-containing protein [Lentimicrobium sp.]|nr:glycoside hydrolase family 30 beta sandwich domain-containing protein [Lentimicrobium sp.]
MKFKELIMKIYAMRFAVIFMVSLATILSCDGKDPDPPDGPVIPPDTTGALVYLTKGDQSVLFNKEGLVKIKTSDAGNFPLITIDTAVRYQTIEGYGAALTGSSAYNLNRRMSTGSRNTLLKNLFDPNTGIGISYLRLTMGASDFSLSNFSYDDVPANQTDFDLARFSLSQDTLDVVPIAKEILAINPGITLLGSPWSPPAWMKTSKDMVGGKLRTDCYDVYGNYFVKYIQAMAENGIPIDAITPQNEPLFGTAGYPCMDMQANEQLEFIKSSLGPKLRDAGLNTKIIIYDHNWDRPDYPMTILDDPDARQYVAGSGFHAYGGSVGAMTTVHNAHPDKDLYFTEISGGEWATDFSSNLLWNMSNIFIGTAKNWSKNALLWNLALDEDHGPKNNGCGDCRGVVTINSGSGVVTKNVEYYSLAHFTKFVRPGAVRIFSKVAIGIANVEVVSFQNTDGSKVMVAANYGDTGQVFTIKQNNKYITYTLQGKSVVTIVW